MTVILHRAARYDDALAICLSVAADRETLELSIGGQQIALRSAPVAKPYDSFYSLAEASKYRTYLHVVDLADHPENHSIDSFDVDGKRYPINQSNERLFVDVSGASDAVGLLSILSPRVNSFSAFSTSGLNHVAKIIESSPHLDPSLVDAILMLCTQIGICDYSNQSVGRILGALFAVGFNEWPVAICHAMGRFYQDERNGLADLAAIHFDSVAKNPWAWACGLSGVMPSPGSIESDEFVRVEAWTPSCETFPPRQKSDSTLLAGCDDGYFHKYHTPYVGSMLAHSPGAGLHIVVINPGEATRSRLDHLRANIPLFGYSILSLELSGMSVAQAKGVYTLARYLLLSDLLDVLGGTVLVCEMDSVVQADIQTSESVRMVAAGDEVGVIVLGKYYRPWIWITAPLVVVSSTNGGRLFARWMQNQSLDYLASARNQYWGVDQAFILNAYCALKSSVRIFNVIRDVPKLFVQAQQHPGGKSAFEREMNDTYESSLRRVLVPNLRTDPV